MEFFMDPNIAYLLLAAGLILSGLALFAPGTGLLEAGAVLMLVLAGISLSSQAVNLWAIGVVLVGGVAFILSLRRPKAWWLVALSLLLFIAGSLFLVTRSNGAPAINPVVAVVTSIVMVVTTWFIARALLAAVARPVAPIAKMVGKTGEAHTDVLAEGSVYVGGEEWSARSRSFIPSGSRVQVVAQEGLLLLVERCEAVDKQVR